ncbi:hypothetical protein PoB_002359000 [Plakobranchus ocellatus]|uniref:C2H2-type domain-containing protein n=1 Tax=Plakobranchus ocellatus TaxID=259542 RepID=A0AAV3ZN29_9GAST|nr:hypothetical protein PoB_002359000 [Plakobranchus ocellatus]
MANRESAKLHLSGIEKRGKSHQREGSAMTSPVVSNRHREAEIDAIGKELPEPIRAARKMPKLPPIGINQVKDMLTKMPEKKIMEQVAVNLTSGAYHSDDSGSEMGMQGLFDCILETTLCSLDQADNSHVQENSPRELPCAFCSKVFLSNLKLETHILVMHSHQDPSLLNVTHVAARRELHRSHSNSKTAASEASDAKARPLSEGLFNMEMSQVVDADLVKHLPPKQRVKASPKIRCASKDQVEQCKKSVGASDGSAVDQSGDNIPQSITQPAPPKECSDSKAISSHREMADRHTSTLGDTRNLSSASCASSEHAEVNEVSGETRTSRLRRRSSALPVPENSSSSSSSSTSTTPSPSPSGEGTRRSSHRQREKLTKPSSSSLSASKRKSTDTSSESSKMSKRSRATAGGRSGSDKQPASSAKQSR